MNEQTLFYSEDMVQGRCTCGWRGSWNTNSPNGRRQAHREIDTHLINSGEENSAELPQDPTGIDCQERYEGVEPA